MGGFEVEFIMVKFYDKRSEKFRENKGSQIMTLTKTDCALKWKRIGKYKYYELCSKIPGK